MNEFIPFIHKIEKKKRNEFQQLYIELDTPRTPEIPKEEEEKEKEDYNVIVIEL
jgi:hypothetical protein